MFYTPKHCCECGEKIDENTRNFFSSRRFCEICESEFKIVDWLPRLFFVVCSVVAVIGIGSSLRKTDQPLSISTAPLVSVSSKENRNPQVLTSQINQTAADNSDFSKKQAPLLDANKKTALSKPEQREGLQNPVSETVYFCGAQTKKGIPCSRRVKGNVRCWQHKGQPAMLPPDKLIAEK
ncbi:MAG: hypothetical protein ACR2L1_08550 [Pyrinomonadaceae bacterium]